MKTFIYGLKDPRTGSLRYIGKANDPKARLRCHREECNRIRNHRCNWVRELLRLGLKPEIVIIDCVPQDNWAFFERAYIKVYQESGFDLVNLTQGGDGWAGGKHSPQTIQKLRDQKLGKRLTEAHKEKIGAAVFGGLMRNNTSGIPGVSWDSSRNKWHAYANRHKKRQYLGRFDSIEAAALARKTFSNV